MRKDILAATCIALLSLAAFGGPSEELREAIKRRSGAEQIVQAHPEVVNQPMPRVAGSGTILPLHEALAIGDAELVKLLLEKGADPNRTSGGRQPMSSFGWAINDLVQPETILKEVDLLLAAKADPNLADDRGLISLHRWAARKSWQKHPAYAQIGERLFQAKAKTMAVDKLGFTPLMVAVINENSEAVRLLLAHGADPKQTTKQGTALDLAEKSSAEVQKLLR